MNASFEPKKQSKAKQAPRHLGSQAAAAHPSQTLVHAKLEVTDPGDQEEREADAIADELMSGGKIARKISAGGGADSGIAVPRQMESRLMHLQGGGMPLPTALRSRMESGFGLEFPGVRIHADSEAASLSESIGARAFTHGNDIYFNRGQFAPDTDSGQRLVAHELTHVVQGGGKVARMTEEENARRTKSQYSDIEFINTNYFDQDIYVVDGDGGRALRNAMVNYLLEPYFYQLLCTKTAKFGKFLKQADVDVFFSLVVEFRDSFQRMIQSSEFLFYLMVPEDSVNERKWNWIVNEFSKLRYTHERKGTNIAAFLRPRVSNYLYNPQYQESGKDLWLDENSYHENRIRALDVYASGEYYDIVKIIPDLMNLNTQDFVEFLHRCVKNGQTYLLEDLTAVQDVPGAAALWEHHVAAFNILMWEQDHENTKNKIFNKVFTPKALAAMGGRASASYREHIELLERKQRIKDEKEAKDAPKEVTYSYAVILFDKILSELDTIISGLSGPMAVLNTANSGYGSFSGVKTGKEMREAALEATAMTKGLKAPLAHIRDALKEYLVDNAQNTSKFGKASAVYGIVSAATDLYTALRQYLPNDIADFPVSVSMIIFLRFCCLASAVLNYPSLLGKIAVTHPATATGIVFFGVGLSIGDLINTGSQKAFGKTPGEMLVDAFM